jgi:23S rRNA (guanine745-N1)-methyltransferase
VRYGRGSASDSPRPAGAGIWFPRPPGTAPERFGGGHYTGVIGGIDVSPDSPPARAVRSLACPVCAEPLAARGAAAACENGHTFDFARSGYLNLMVGRGGRCRVGDTPEMVRARAELLARGHLDPLSKAIAERARPWLDRARLVVELGSGTGHYLAAATAEGGIGIGIDLSKAAAAHAARAHPGLLFAVADVEESIPLVDGAAGVLLSVFAPRPAAEAARVVRPGGSLVAALATERHLAGLRRELGLIGVHPGKPERLQERLAPAFEPVSAETVEYDIELTPEDARLVVAMGPSARHEPASVAYRARRDVVSVDVLVFCRLDAC